jgi:carboxyl-terminal processing protease
MPPGAGRDRTSAWHFGTGLVSGLVLAAILGRLRPSEEEPDLHHYREVRDFVRETFVREPDAGEMVDRALHGMVEGLDTYSRYYDEPEVAELERETGGRYTGFGLVLRRPYDKARVLFTLPGSPAAEGGLQVGDRILRLDGEPVEGMRDEDVQARLQDETRESVRFSLLGLDGVERDVVLARASLVDPTVRHERIADAERGIGYLAIRSFTHETPDELDRAFERLSAQGMHALVIDLRANFGGVLASAVDVARRFLPEGVIVSTEGRGDPVVYDANPSEALHAGFPLVVLVDGASASASEVLAGALRDHRAAVLCGTPTYGKGMVQTIRHFPDAGAVAKVTSSYYYTPSHLNLERSASGDRGHGLMPDLVVPLTEAERRAVYDFLDRLSPPAEALPAIRAWEQAEGLHLIPLPPPDAQLDAALQLLSGRRPGPYALDEDA